VACGIVLLGLGVAIPATFSAPVFVYVIWIIVGAAAGVRATHVKHQLS